MEIEIKFTATEYEDIKKYLCPNNEDLKDTIKRLTLQECKNRKLVADFKQMKV